MQFELKSQGKNLSTLWFV